MSLARALPAAVLLLLALPSCGGTPPAPQAPAAPVALAAPALPKPPDLSAVPDPSALVASGRLAKPSASLAIVRQWTNLPQPQSEDVTELMTGEAMGALVDLDQPIDFAVVVAGTGLRIHDRTAVSAVLKDVERTKAALQERYKLVPGENGALLVQGLGHATSSDADADEHGDDDSRACEIAPAYGPASTRLVCAWGGKALSDLAPWLTRTASRAATTSDLHVELRMQPLRATLSAAKRLIGGMLAGLLGGGTSGSGTRELLSSAGGDVVDFGLDLDTAALDVELTQAAGHATAAVRFSRSASALARLVTAHPDRSAAPPAAFWQMPGDADFAFFERGIDDAEIARARDLALHVASDRLAEEGIPEADRKPIVEALGKLTTSAPVAYASGFDQDAAMKAMAAVRSHKDGSDPAALQEARRASAEVLLGWHVMAVDEPAVRFVAALDDIARVWARPTVASAFRAKGRPSPALRQMPVPKGGALPVGTQHYVIEYPLGAGRHEPSGKPKVASIPSKAVAMHLIIAPEGTRTWVGLGGGDALVASKLAASIAPASPDSLAARAEMAPFKTAVAGSAGFVTLRAVAGGAGFLAAIFGDLAEDIDGFDEFPQLPHRGAVPIWFSSTPGGRRGASHRHPRNTARRDGGHRDHDCGAGGACGGVEAWVLEGRCLRPIPSRSLEGRCLRPIPSRSLEGRCLSADPFAIPLSSVLAYRSTLRALATGLARARPKYTGLLPT